MKNILATLDQQVATAAARRELEVFRRLLTERPTADIARTWVDAHQAWAERLLSLPAGALRAYLQWRLEMFASFGLMGDGPFLVDATENMLLILRKVTPCAVN